MKRASIPGATSCPVIPGGGSGHQRGLLLGHRASGRLRPGNRVGPLPRRRGRARGLLRGAWHEPTDATGGPVVPSLSSTASSSFLSWSASWSTTARISTKPEEARRRWRPPLGRDRARPWACRLAPRRLVASGPEVPVDRAALKLELVVIYSGRHRLPPIRGVLVVDVSMT
jgi:hypothetical protein